MTKGTIPWKEVYSSVVDEARSTYEEGLGTCFYGRVCDMCLFQQSGYPEDKKWIGWCRVLIDIGEGSFVKGKDFTVTVCPGCCRKVNIAVANDRMKDLLFHAFGARLGSPYCERVRDE